MPQYDPQRSRPRQKLSDEEPAPVDALLEPQPTRTEQTEPVEVPTQAAAAVELTPVEPTPVESTPVESGPSQSEFTPLTDQSSRADLMSADSGTDVKRMVLVTSAVVAAVMVIVWMRRRFRR